MYYKRKSNVIFRDYKVFGYITDNRNFGYRQENDDGNDIGDKIISSSGSIFLSVLGREAQTLDCLAEKIISYFPDVDINIIKRDARDFYELLVIEGFIVSGKTKQECDEKDIGFSYNKAIVANTKIKYFLNKELKKSTQDFLDEYFQGEPQLTNLHIEITSKCNEKCVHCYIPHENKLYTMNPNLFYDILEQCRRMNLLHLTISGGEPMAHNSFIDFIKKCNEYNFSVNVLSNLTLINDDILEEMKKNHLLSVQTSLYSMNANIHDAITQVRGSFEKTKNAILKIVEYNIPLQISCPIMKLNQDSYYDVVEWGKERNINVGSDYVIIARYNHTTQNLSNRLSIDDVHNIIKQQINDNPHYLNQIVLEAENKKKSTPDDFACSICHSSICISEIGNVYPCAGWQDYVVGNIKESSLNEIWHNSTKIKYLRNLRKRDFPKCIHCQVKEFCTMCMVRNANEDPSGNPLVVNEYFCNITKMKAELVHNRTD